MPICALVHPLDGSVRGIRHASLGLSIALWADAEVRNGQALEEMRRGNCGRRVLLQGLLKLWIIECDPEVGDGFPYGVVHKYAAAGDSLMELSRNETGLSFHPDGIQFPRLKECRNIRFGDMEDVY